MKQSLTGFGCVILGGNDPFDCLDDIYIYDVKCNEFKKSKVICPHNEWYHAFITDNTEYNNLLTKRYINDCYKMNSFANLQILSNDLIKFICSWISNQYIHLMKLSGGEHWKIDVNHILNDIESI